MDMMTLHKLSGLVWVSDLVKFLITLIVFLIVLILQCSCLVAAVKQTVHRFTKAAIQAPQRMVSNAGNDIIIMMYYDY